jgi:GNAT superfamily N-acetyltransferase
MEDVTLREMTASDIYEGAELICVSHNTWTQLHALQAPFSGGPKSTELFFNVCEALDGSHGVVAENNRTRRLAGLSFYHVRHTHVSVGMMSVHPNYFQSGVGKALLGYITDIADRQGKPVRLVSSALNLDSFSLYSRAGFVPQHTYQDILINVPEKGFAVPRSELVNIRSGTASDIADIVNLEYEISGIQRENDYHHLIENRDSFWHVSVFEGETGLLDGFMVSCGHPDIRMLGPGIARTQEQALSLILEELNIYRGSAVLLLVPVDGERIVHPLYELGGRNIELHLFQVRGTCPSITGVFMPTYILETG